MNKLLLVLLAVSAAGTGFIPLRRAAEEHRRAVATLQEESQAVTNALAETQKTLAARRTQILDKKNRLQDTRRHETISPELLRLLETDAAKAQPAAWAELRQQLGIGWDSSPDYVLVNKQILKQLDYPRLLSGLRASDTASDLLAISPSEQSALRSILDRAREGQWLRMERTEPGGDIVAQYTVPQPDLAFEQTQSNLFVTEITNLLGPQRADFFVSQAWREFKSGLAPAEAETMIIRRSVVDGEPDLVCEMRRGSQFSSMPVRYAHYPSMWFLTMFPGGWKTLAHREGFELPPKFQK